MVTLLVAFLFDVFSFFSGVSVDLEESLRWALRAAQKGDVDAQFEVAQRYAGGVGTAQSTEQAIVWIETYVVVRFVYIAYFV